MMKRRGFLKTLLGAAVAPLVGKVAADTDGVALTSIAHPMRLRGIDELGLPRAEDILDPRPGGFIDVVSNPRDQIKNILYNGTRRVFEIEYEDAPPIFSDDGVTWSGVIKACDCDDGPHGTACSNRNVLFRKM